MAGQFLVESIFVERVWFSRTDGPASSGWMDSSDRGGGRVSLDLKASEGVCGMHASFGGIQRQSTELLANFWKSLFFW